MYTCTLHTLISTVPSSLKDCERVHFTTFLPPVYMLTLSVMVIYAYDFFSPLLARTLIKSSTYVQTLLCLELLQSVCVCVYLCLEKN